ncbi:GNAT family N-acetyltransferase [Tropicimonas isoalkanivorans]|uniref:Acetyltransferase (GNAT) domain-containing protein n=1 Tax=Tropicimonas isoalkanivorans TaxID=441112 RepID=A0A1I1MMC8_9RHOB|nr:GNAT family N-acetyltransferase [Tropicimonas isoalkanivorans]SFC84338.1 Acetyltransferase (GNAT) domain-containing protein [Tropicimonas isoalkanivorans]
MKLDWIETESLRLPQGLSALPMQQHEIYGQACEATGCRVRRFALSAGPSGPVRASAQVLVRRWPLLGQAALLSRGPVWEAEVPLEERRAALNALLERLRQEHRAVAVTPEIDACGDPLAESGWLEAVTPCTLASLRVDASEDELRARMSGKWRNRLKRAEQAELEGLEIRDAPMPPKQDHWLLRKEVIQSRARGYRSVPPEFTRAWVAAGGPGSARLFTAWKGGLPAAAMLFLVHSPGASYHVGWTGPAGRETAAHNLLLWRAMLWLRDRGVKQLDLDVLDTAAAPGLVRFKLGSGARALSLGATRLMAPGSRFFAAPAA